jgi:hypothetical protein
MFIIPVRSAGLWCFLAIIKPVPFRVQPLFYRSKSYKFCEVSFDGIKYYTFALDNVLPHSWTRKMDYIITYTDSNEIKCDGYYDKVEKTLWFFYNEKINKLYRLIVKRQKLERNKQTFLLSDDDIRRKEKMSLKDLDELKSGRIDLDDSPKFIYPQRIEKEVKERTNQKGITERCLYLNLFWEEDGKEIFMTQMYTPWHLVQLVKRMKLMKLKDVTKHLAPLPWKLESEVFSGTGNPRYMPVQSEE